MQKVKEISRNQSHKYQNDYRIVLRINEDPSEVKPIIRARSKHESKRVGMDLLDHSYIFNSYCNPKHKEA